jgi:hypothetical protein
MICSAIAPGAVAACAALSPPTPCRLNPPWRVAAKRCSIAASKTRAIFSAQRRAIPEQQDLIAAPERYAEAVPAAIDALEQARRRSWRWKSVPVTAGYSRLWQSATQMLSLWTTRQRCWRSRNSAPKQQGSTTSTSSKVIRAARRLLGSGPIWSVINMVLHHTPDPSRTLAEAAATLKPGGVLLITELCEHGQGWARESCGDLWLGFAPQQLQTWAAAAGLRKARPTIWPNATDSHYRCGSFRHPQ